jgi:hypothetical protein
MDNQPGPEPQALFPTLTAAQLQRIAACGTMRDVDAETTVVGRYGRYGTSPGLANLVLFAYLPGSNRSMLFAADLIGQAGPQSAI